MKLREALSQRSPELAARLKTIEMKARQLLEYSQGGSHLSFTPHGLSHVSAVEDNYDWLLSDDDVEAMVDLEIFLLLCATLFHDIMMIPSKPGLESESRTTHAFSVYKFLNANHELVGVTINEADVISEIVKGHGVSSFEEVREEQAMGSKLVSIRKMAACLSLADLCHADTSRAPEIVYNHLELTEESQYHWRKHLQISGVTRKLEKILITALCFSDKGQQAVEEFAAEVTKQLNIVRPYFHTQLSPFDGVKLDIKRLQSVLEVPLKFQANTGAILDMLIEGVYERSDVFLRELIQNSIDACHIRMARALKRSEQYRPQIIVTQLIKHGKPVGIRIDDNGIGMDINDVQDTVLWIGNTVSKREDVNKLLSETTKKSLIATFGIGLLSCFKCGSKITIRTKKENCESVEFSVSSITDQIHPSESPDKSEGTTVLIYFKDEASESFDLDTTLRYYFWQLHNPEIRYFDLPVDKSTLEMVRSEILKNAIQASKLPQVTFDVLAPHICCVEIKGDDFIGWISIPQGEKDSLVFDEGKVIVLSEGVYVAEVKSSDWLPEHLFSANGLLNFSAKAIDLPVSRDQIVKNKRLEEKIREIEARSASVIEKLVDLSSSPNEKEAQLSVLALTSIYRNATNTWQKKIINRLGRLCVKPYLGNRNVEIGSILDQHPQKVYATYSSGRWVKDLAIVDDKQLYHNPNDFTDLLAVTFTQRGKMVIECARRDDASRENDVIEVELLKPLLEANNIKLIDLTEFKRQSTIQTKPVSTAAKLELGDTMRFVSVPNLINKRGWVVEETAWLNEAHPDVRQVYEILRSKNPDRLHFRLAIAAAKLLAFKFEDGINDIFHILDSLDES